MSHNIILYDQTLSGSSSLLGCSQASNTSEYLTTSQVPQRSSAVHQQKTMGGVVSTMGAMLCGSARSAQETDEVVGRTDKPQTTALIVQNGELLPQQRPVPRPRQHSYLTQESDQSDQSEYCDAQDTNQVSVEPMTTRQQAVYHSRSSIPYMDDDTDSVNDNVNSSSKLPDCVNRENTGLEQPLLSNDLSPEEVIILSEPEYSADEEQDEEEGEGDAPQYESQDEEGLERIDSEVEEYDESEEEHICDSDCDHPEEIIDDESEAASDEEHVCDSECDHSDIDEEEEVYEDNSEHEDVIESDNEEDIVLSANELSCDEAQESDLEDELEVCECDSDCPSDCDGDHHECSSECDCEYRHSQSDSEGSVSLHGDVDEQTDSDNEYEQVLDNSSDIPTESHLNKPPSPPPIVADALTRQSSLPSASGLEDNHRLRPTPAERNNNKVQRNHSQRILQRSNTGNDMIGELKTAIDARVRRTASCRETTTDYRKRYAHLSNSGQSDIMESISKLDVKDQEARRKDRRSRLRTLELKREQFLDNIRGGNEDQIIEKVYQEHSIQEAV